MDTRDVSDIRLLKFKDFKSLDQQTRHDYYRIKNAGYDYKTNGLLNKMVSKYLLRNTKFSKFISWLDEIVIWLVDRVKHVQFFYNFGVDKRDIEIINK